MEHSGKCTPFNDTQAEKNKLPFKSDMSTKNQSTEIGTIQAHI